MIGASGVETQDIASLRKDMGDGRRPRAAWRYMPAALMERSQGTMPASLSRTVKAVKFCAVTAFVMALPFPQSFVHISESYLYPLTSI